jgi:hypothetical protein
VREGIGQADRGSALRKLYATISDLKQWPWRGGAGRGEGTRRALFSPSPYAVICSRRNQPASSAASTAVAHVNCYRSTSWEIEMGAGMRRTAMKKLLPSSFDIFGFIGWLVFLPNPKTGGAGAGAGSRGDAVDGHDDEIGADLVVTGLRRHEQKSIPSKTRRQFEIGKGLDMLHDLASCLAHGPDH